MNRPLFVAAAVLFLTLAGCGKAPGGGPGDGGPADGGADAGTADAGTQPTWPPQVVSTRTLLPSGAGRLDWCAANDLIAFDRVHPDGSSDVYTIHPDGTGEQCVTCNTPNLPAGLRGQPAWHPGCDMMVIEVQGVHYQGTRFEFLSWGIDDDLWVVAADGSWAEPLVTVPALGASLHPQFSRDGTRLFWAVRESTGVTVPQRPADPTPGQENPWDGWHLAIADFSRPAGGPAAITNRVDLYRGEGGFFESHALVGNEIWFSHTSGGQPFVAGAYRAHSDGTSREALVPDPGTWNEHVTPAPNGLAYAFNSSRAFSWQYPPDLANTLQLEVWMGRDGEAPVQLTHFNDAAGTGWRVLTSDYAFGPNGDEIAVYHLDVGPSGQKRQAIDILTLSAAY